MDSIGCMGAEFVYLWLGTKLKYKPGIVMGGRHLTHDCGASRSIGYFLEPLLVLGLFGKKPLTIRLKGKLLCPFEHDTDKIQITKT